ncbi:MAG: ABC transporter substrate-binding protein [Rhizobiales bacterium]|nr:ABC transporter substrate-binding protein [Hyphomicrobiales bacterium]
MRLKTLLLAGVFATGLGLGSANAVTFRYAFQGDLNALDPYTLNETFTLAALGNVYEGLTKRDKELKIIPGLAEKWEIVDPLRWRFYLRKGVKFAGGEDFTADDVVFSVERALAPGSQVSTRLPKDVKVVKVDDHTVDFVLTSPNPILHAEWDTWYIMSRKWAEANGAVKPQPATGKELNNFALKSNGTGPFVITSHEPAVKTIYKPNPGWWGKKEHNLDEVIFTTIKQDATRVAALLSGEVDMIEPVPVQDMQRIDTNPTTSVMTGAELRVIHLFFDQKRDELLYSNVKGKNPFKDVRVRKAFYQAIDIEAIKTKVMRNMATPVSILMAPMLFSRSAELKRWPYDPAASKKLLAEAGYPDGFEVTMHCPNDRYVNDEAICQAATAMFARAGLKVTLQAQPKAQFFGRAGASGGFDTSLGMLGWTPSSFDAWNVLTNLAGCRDDKGVGGPFNYGGYCNKKVDELSAKILVETDTAKRDQMILDAWKTINDETGFIPLHQQSLAWGVSKKVKMVQRPDDQILLQWVVKEP